MDDPTAGLPSPEVHPPRRGGGLRRRAARGVFWVSIRTWSMQLGGLLVFLVLARLLEPAHFGLIALAAVFLDIVDAVVEQGFSNAIIQRQELEEAHLDSAFWISVVLALVFLVATLALAASVANFLRQPDLAPILRVLSVTFLFVALRSVQEAQLRRRLEFKIIAVRAVAAVVVGGIIGIGMALNGYGVWSLVGQQVAREATAVAVLWTTSTWRPGLRATWRHARELWGFSVNVTAVRLAVFGTRRLTDLLIGRSLGAVALGYFTVGGRLVVAVNRMLVASVTGVALPAFSRLAGDLARIRAAWYDATRYVALVAFPAFVGAAALAPEIVPLWFGPRWVPAVPVMQVLALLGLNQTISAFNGAVLQAIGQARTQLYFSIFTAVTTLAAILIAMPHGIVAVAAALVIRGWLAAPITSRIVRSYVAADGRDYLKQFAAAAAGSAAVAVTVLALRLALADQVGTTMLLTVAVTISTAVYVVTVRAAAPQTFRDAIQLIHSALPRLRSRATARSDDPPEPHA